MTTRNGILYAASQHCRPITKGIEGFTNVTD